MIHLIQHSSLDKITANTLNTETPYTSDCIMMGEEFGYQIVVYRDDAKSAPCSITFEGMFVDPYVVKQVAVTWPHYESDPKEGYLLDQPGLLPDCLVPLKRGETINISEKFSVIWVSVTPPLSGDFHIRSTFTCGEESATAELDLRVLKAPLAKQFFGHCQYIDPISIAMDHNIPMYSDVHWDLLAKYFTVARKNGINELLTPIFTPEYPGYPRKESVQLVRINVSGKDYTFDYGLLDSWIVIAKRCGFDSFVFPPILPSFENPRGARFLAKKDGEQVVLFEGEEITSNYYAVFLRKFLFNLVKHLDELKIRGQITFQFSVSPQVKDEELYRTLRAHLYDRVRKHRIADYDVRYDFYKTDNVSIPIIRFTDMEEYLDDPFARISGCFDVESTQDPINPLIASSSVNLRALGPLCYRYDIVNFFHMGFNYAADMRMDFDYDNRYPSGSLALVYAGGNEVYPSVRLKQMLYAMQDYRIFGALQQKYSVNRLKTMIDKDLKLTLKKCSCSAQKYQALRAKLYELAERLDNRKR